MNTRSLLGVFFGAISLVLMISFQNFSPLSQGSRVYELYLKDGNNLIGYICASDGFSLRAERGNHRLQISHVLRFDENSSSRRHKMWNRFKYLKSACGNSRKKLYFISQRLTGNVNTKTYSNVRFKLNGSTVNPVVLTHSRDHQVGILYSTFHCHV
ncbi:MAG: hypothetical protein HRT45_06250 [Bdellovibrionales bacterium]|nr:hypothetical protein [Bdellovibrionales bacterium]